MIHSNNGTTNMQGNIVSLMSDLIYILRGVREILVNNFSETDSDEIIGYCLRVSRMMIWKKRLRKLSMTLQKSEGFD